MNSKVRQSKTSRFFSHKILAKFYGILKNKKTYCCPICSYQGPFLDLDSFCGVQKNAICPLCRSFERHRLQYLIFEKLSKNCNFQDMSILHIAPEKILEQLFRKTFKSYLSADLMSSKADVKEDLLKLSFKDNSFDVVFASHVLEHIKEDEIALKEISRVLKPTGIAILPVPILSAKTVEYQMANLYEDNHVRCPGKDYFDKYRKHFSKVEIYSSCDVAEKYQVYICEDRMHFSKELMPNRSRMEGAKHKDFVPVCYK